MEWNVYQKKTPSFYFNIDKYYQSSFYALEYPFLSEMINFNLKYSEKTE